MPLTLNSSPSVLCPSPFLSRDAASEYGTVRSVQAYGNPATFSYVSRDLSEQRRETKQWIREEDLAMRGKKAKKGARR